MYRKSAIPCERLINSAGHIRHLKQILFICSCVCEVGYSSTFEWENACAIYCF